MELYLSLLEEKLLNLILIELNCKNLIGKERKPLYDQTNVTSVIITKKTKVQW